MRTIKFRGYNRKNKQWLYGFYLQNRGAHFVCPDEFANGKTWEDYEIDPNTLGQFTGFTNVYGRDVYEGDIVHVEGERELRAVVYYEEAFNIATAAELESLQRGAHPYMNDYAHMTCLNEWSNTGLVLIAGNIHDNPELLKQ